MMNNVTTQHNAITPETSSKKGGIGAILVILFILAIVVAGLVLFKDTIAAMFDPVSIVATVTASELKESDGRTNILLLGSDRRSTDNVVKSELTDTILVISIGKIDKDVVLISLPRDLWAEWESTSGFTQHSKINAIYASDYNGSDVLMNTIEDVLGMPIHYYGLVTFDLFQEVINILGGVEVNVENAFTDYYYPIEGQEDNPVIADRYETIHFEQGLQTMDGDTALKYVRSRKGDNNEGTDFARAKRQQNVIEAMKRKVFSAKTLLNISKIKDLYDAYKENVDTNIDFGTIQSFYLLSQKIEFDKITSIVLDDRSDANEGGLLYSPEDAEPYNGQYVLIPQTGDYSQIHAYVQRYLFGNR